MARGGGWHIPIVHRSQILLCKIFHRSPANSMNQETSFNGCKLKSMFQKDSNHIWGLIQWLMVQSATWDLVLRTHWRHRILENTQETQKKRKSHQACSQAVTHQLYHSTVNHQFNFLIRLGPGRPGLAKVDLPRGYSSNGLASHA